MTARMRTARQSALLLRAPVLAAPITRASLCGSLVAPRQTISRGYHEDLIDHYENPRNVGRLDKQADNVGTGLVGAPACGDVMQLQIRVDEDGTISESKFKTFGCGSAIASSSLATEVWTCWHLLLGGHKGHAADLLAAQWLKGKSLDEAASITNKQIATELKLPPVKLHCRCAFFLPSCKPPLHFPVQRGDDSRTQRMQCRQAFGGLVPDYGPK